ncbi:MAG: hypothetical protein ACUVS2_05375 [Candidatus Flexifilum sp.]|jgi:hypothetical protein
MSDRDFDWGYLGDDFDDDDFDDFISGYDDSGFDDDRDAWGWHKPKAEEEPFRPLHEMLDDEEDEDDEDPYRPPWWVVFLKR